MLPLVPLDSSFTPPFFTFASHAAFSANPAKTPPKSASMPPHATPTFSSWTATAVAFLYVLTGFTPTLSPANALHVILGAVYALLGL